MLTRVVLCDAIHRDQEPALALMLREQVGTVCISLSAWSESASRSSTGR